MTYTDIDVLSGLLQLIQSTGTSMHGRIRLQKAAYLLKLKGVKPFASLNYRLHYYGPYCSELADTLENAVVLGLLTESGEGFENGYYRYSYELGVSGKKWLQDAKKHGYDVDGIDNSDATLLRGEDASVLELASTILFFRLEQHSSDPVSDALKMKPHLKGRLEEATKLIQSLDLLGTSVREKPTAKRKSSPTRRTKSKKK